MARRIELPLPDDFHVHLRSGERLGAYALREAECYGRALVMPNTLPPLVDGPSVAAYGEAVRAATASIPGGFEPLLTFKLLPGMDGATVRGCAAAGAIAGKYYPAGATTNSADGVRSPDDIAEALAAMEELGLVLSIHGEDPSAPVLDREEAFLPVVGQILSRHSRLRVVLEHLSTRAALGFVLAGPGRLAGTLTAHHLLCDLDDLMGESLSPHLFCKPVVKTRADRDALRAAAFRGEARLFFGSDSAPHPRAKKESGQVPAGLYCAPTSLSALVQLFHESGAEAQLRPFLCGRGAAFYGLPPAAGGIVLVEEDWTVPEETDGSVPFLAGKTLHWKVESRA